MKQIKFMGEEDTYSFQIGHDCSCWIRSFETRRLGLGDLRMFGNLVMQISKVTYSSTRNSYEWMPIDEALLSQEEFQAWAWKYNTELFV